MIPSFKHPTTTESGPSGRGGWLSRPLPFAALFALLLPACGDSGTGLVERDLSDSELALRIVPTSMERFRYSSAPSKAATADDAKPAGLVHETPEGWTEAPGSPMRDLSFTFGEKGEGECYVARLPGSGGGLAANVNRWRAQMGAAPLSDEEIAALPVKPLFHQPARFVSVDGTFSPGMGSTETFENYRLLGVILSSEAGAVFVKMTGPKELVEKHSEAFDRFVGSLDVNTH